MAILSFEHLTKDVVRIHTTTVPSKYQSKLVKYVHETDTVEINSAICPNTYNNYVTMSLRNKLLNSCPFIDEAINIMGSKYDNIIAPFIQMECNTSMPVVKFCGDTSKLTLKASNVRIEGMTKLHKLIIQDNIEFGTIPTVDTVELNLKPCWTCGESFNLLKIMKALNVPDNTYITHPNYPYKDTTCVVFDESIRKYKIEEWLSLFPKCERWKFENDVNYRYVI